jgi:hypothetical protein
MLAQFARAHTVPPSCRLVEESDFELAQEAFGGSVAVDPNTFKPKSPADFEMYAKVVVSKFLKPHEVRSLQVARCGDRAAV